MHNKNFINSREVACFVFNLCFYRSLTHVPGLFAKNCGTGAPLASLISGLIAFGIISALLMIYKKCGCRSITDLAEKCLGKPGNVALSVVLVLYILISSAFALREFSLLAAHIAFPSTPLWFVAAFFAVAALFAACCGMNAILRAHTVIVPFLILMTIIVVVSALGYAKSDNLFPILGNGIDAVFGQSVSGTLLYSDIILLFMLNPFDDVPSDLKLKPFFFAAGGGILLSFLVVLTFTATSAFPESVSVRFPVYQLLKTVWYGRFFQRIDAIYMLTVVLSGMLYLSATVRLASSTAERCLTTKNMSGKSMMSVCMGIVALSVFVLALSYEIFSDVRLKQCFDVVAIVAVAVTMIFFTAGVILKFFKGGTER